MLRARIPILRWLQHATFGAIGYIDKCQKTFQGPQVQDIWQRSSYINKNSGRLHKIFKFPVCHARDSTSNGATAASQFCVHR